ncbi:GNAT family N-acetyltransferase [Amnibacterium flavum]|uniref:N-acetyltransferase n=1 Tax=Amnibacterium flavum TaxID=2173173 RepID=A0A2V1HNR2_9MICO|nr:GNAT family N-acetyltransferase [Amnibacterium flavum]PVZ93222.1 N-acetyltransferase [Amnibacterium flavum]
MSSVILRTMTAEDWPDVERIYSDGIATGHATFDPSPPPNWEAFIESKHPELRLVAVLDGTIAGWAAASPVSARAAYRGVVEHSIYISPGARGNGVGRALLAELIAAAESTDIWTIQSSIFPENGASLRLHESLGFRPVGTRERIAQMTYGPASGQWRDTILVERRRAEN